MGTQQLHDALIRIKALEETLRQLQLAHERDWQELNARLAKLENRG